MQLKDKKILVTGADGFIGSHLTEKLVRENHRVKAFVLYNSFNSWGWLDRLEPGIKERVEVYSGDVRDPFGVRKAVAGCDIVFHLAALIAIPYSYRSPATYIETNVQGTLNVVQAALDEGVNKVVHTSTSEVYGTARYTPIDENHPLQGQSPYSASKIGADQIAMSYYHAFDLPVAIIRPFNTYGPRQSARAVIPTLITQLASGCRNVKIGSLHPTRDFSYVEDTVDGFIAVAESDSTVGEVVNVGSEFEISIGELVGLIGEVMGVEPELEIDEARVRPEKSEVDRLLADAGKAKRLTRWHPKYSGTEGFKEGLRKTAAWFGRAENLAAYKADIYNI